jgi:hypothetical protein
MKQTLFLLALFALIVFFGTYTLGWRPHSEYLSRVLLRDVKVLTLERGKMTTSRRSAPIPQLQCVGGSACRYSEYFPSVVQCYNMGIDDNGEVQWRCEADLDPDVKFGKVTVSCEGFDSPDDPYILQGSCGLEYHLEFTNLGIQKMQKRAGYFHEQRHHEDYAADERSNLVGMLIFFFFAMLICLCCCAIKNQNRTRYPVPVSVAPTSSPAMEFPMPSAPPYSVPTATSFSPNVGNFATGFVTGAAVGYTAARVTQPSPMTTHVHYHSDSPKTSSSQVSSDASASRTATGYGGTKKR